MIRFRRLLPTLILMLLLSALAACATNPVTGQSELMLINEADEIAMGTQAAPSLKWSYGGQYKDAMLQQYLEPIVLDIWRNSERPQLPVQFVIQDTSLPNAFALPGYVAITRGLLCEMENEAQFVAVMGHEVGHVMARHSAKRISLNKVQQMGLELGDKLLQNNKYNKLLMGAGAVGSSLMLLSYSREQELQSDSLGVKYMSRLGYDPNEAVGAHVTLQHAVDNYLANLGQQRSSGTFMDTILSTHPRHEVRVDEIKATVQTVVPYTLKGDGLHAERFNKALEQIRIVNEAYRFYDRAELALSKDDLDKADEELNNALRTVRRPAFLTLKSIVRLRQDRLEQANNFLTEALKMDKDYQPAVFALGLLKYRQANYYEAYNQFNQSLELYPGHPDSIFGAGAAQYKRGVYQEAIPYLSVYAQINPRHPEIHGMLGVSYDRVGNMAAARQAYANQLQVAPDNELGKIAQQRLKELQ